MRVLVCGSRHFNDYARLKTTLEGLPIDTIIEGEARGADKLAAKYGEEKGIPVQRFPADWKLHGRRAGPIRNSQMLSEGKPDYVVAFLAKDSRGTKNMIELARQAGLDVEIVNIGDSK
jgi:hypothetical protein